MAVPVRHRDVLGMLGEMIPEHLKIFELAGYRSRRDAGDYNHKYSPARHDRLRLHRLPVHTDGFPFSRASGPKGRGFGHTVASAVTRSGEVASWHSAARSRKASAPVSRPRPRTHFSRVFSRSNEWLGCAPFSARTTFDGDSTSRMTSWTVGRPLS